MFEDIIAENVDYIIGGYKMANYNLIWVEYSVFWVQVNLEYLFSWSKYCPLKMTINAIPFINSIFINHSCLSGCDFRPSKLLLYCTEE